MAEILGMLGQETFIIISLVVSMFLSVFFLTLRFFPDEKQAAARKRLGMVDETERPNQIALLRIFRPFYTLLLPQISVRKLGPQRTNYHRKLITANMRDEITPDEFMALKVVMTFFIPLLIVYIGVALGFSIPLLGLPILFVLGFVFPDLWLAERVAIRRRAITRALPYTLDLLTLSVEAGLDFIAAIQRLSERTDQNALLLEFNHMLKEIRLGTSRADALKNLSDRLQIEEITSFTTLLIQADQLGASIGQVLRAQSDQLRSKRFQLAEAAGARASQLILLPLVICIFPAIFIVILGPIILSIVQRGFF